MFSFKPYTEAEIQELSNPFMLQEGTYDFTVKTIVDDVSKSSGNPMLKVTLGIINKNGQEVLVTDYIMTTGKMVYKFKHFCNAINENYDAGKIDLLRCRGKRGACIIIVQKGNEKPDGTLYPDRNAVKDYVKSNNVTPAIAKSQEINEDIPF